jgi:uncharacterized protein (DUF433 family)
MSDVQGRIVRNPAILGGKPTIRGTRMSVEFIIGVMADGWSVADILANYPHITRDDVAACLCYARQVVCTYRGPLRRELHS